MFSYAEIRMKNLYIFCLVVAFFSYFTNKLVNILRIQMICKFGKVTDDVNRLTSLLDFVSFEVDAFEWRARTLT